MVGIWGGKGQGKTFQCNLAFKKLAIVPVVMSAGELESGNAGEPAKLIRQRYREASDVIKKVGSIHVATPLYLMLHWGMLRIKTPMKTCICKAPFTAITKLHIVVSSSGFLQGPIKSNTLVCPS